MNTFPSETHTSTQPREVHTRENIIHTESDLCKLFHITTQIYHFLYRSEVTDFCPTSNLSTASLSLSLSATEKHLSLASISPITKSTKNFHQYPPIECCLMYSEGSAHIHMLSKLCI